jgi:Tfp pilus assembly protein FimT
MKSLTGRKGYVVIVAGIAMIIGSTALTTLALPMMFPGMRVRQFDNSAQETASFLEQARAESMLRNAPVICRLRTDGTKAVLELDWNLGGAKVHPDGRRLALPRGMVVSQSGPLQTSGTIAIFNPRGGVAMGSGKSGSARSGAVLAALDLSWPGTLPNDQRQISMVDGGTFEVANPTSDSKNVQYAVANQMEAK